MPTLKEIETAVRQYAAAAESLRQLGEDYQAAIDEVDARFRAQIKQQAQRTAQRESNLNNLIDDGREHFTKPKTRVIDGVKFGLRKQKGSLEWDCSLEVLIARIDKHFPSVAEMLAPARGNVSKPTLERLTAAELKKLGVEIQKADDAIVIAHTEKAADQAITVALTLAKSVEA